MTNHSDPQAGQPLAADDPRLSEWIDGRLTVAEAAEVERAVRASPDLSRVVADLRAIKEATRLVPAASPPAGFVEQVMAAIAAGDTANADAAADRVVAEEWRAIEAERIAEERAEAEVDREEAARERPAAPQATPRRAWPWLAIGTALAAGLLAAVALNPPEDAPREVARVEPQAERRRLAVEERNAVPAAGAESPPAAERPRATEEFAAARDEKLRSAETRAAMPPGATGDDGKVAAGEVASLKAAAENLAADRAAVPPAPAAARSGPLPAAPLIVTVGSWAEFDQLLEAHGIEARPLDGPDLESRDKAATDWNLELSGPVDGLDGFLAAAGASGLEGRLQATREQAKQAAATDATADRQRELARAERKPQPNDRTLVVRLVIRQPAGREAGRTAAPGAGEKPNPADDDGGSP